MSRVADVVAAVTSVAYRPNGEADLHDAIETTLQAAGIDVAREVRLTARDRVDLLAGTVAIEVKTAGTWVAAVRQCQRYAHHPHITDVVLATTVTAHLQAPDQIGGKPLHVIHLGGGWLT